MSSRKYHVYGVGNALVDIEVETTPEQLVQLGVEKGLMTLVDAERQQQLLAALTGVQHSRSGGGSAANTITAFAQLGGQAYYSCRIADDEVGHFFADQLRAAGVDSNVHVDRGAEGPTGTCLVMITPDADRTMNTSLGISATLTAEQLVEHALAAAEYLYVEGYLVSTPNSLATALQARELAARHGVKTAMTFSDPAMVQYCRDGLDQLLGDGVDVLFCNETEAKGFTGCDTVEEAGDVLLPRAGILVLTLGPKGSRIWDGSQWLDIPGRVVKAVDTNGAGDLYAGAFLYGLTHGHGCQKAGELAGLASSTLVGHFGARLHPAGLAEAKAAILG